MKIVDSQVHIWRPEVSTRMWESDARERIKKMGHREEPFGYEECIGLMDEAGVDKVILVPPSYEGDRLDFVLEACVTYPDRFAIIGRVNQNRPEESKKRLREYLKNPHILGARVTFHRPNHDMPWMIDGTSDWYWPFAEEHGIKTMVHAPTWKKEVGEIARRHPDLTLIIDHMGIISGTKDEDVAPFIDGTTTLAQYPNVGVKLSSIPNYSTEPFPHDNMKPYVHQLIEAFGPERCYWGTDITRLLPRQLTYQDTITQFTEHFGLKSAELDWIMGQALIELLDWQTPKPTNSHT